MLENQIDFLRDISNCVCPHCKNPVSISMKKRGFDVSIKQVHSIEYRLECSSCGMIVIGNFYFSYKVGDTEDVIHATKTSASVIDFSEIMRRDE